MPCILLTYIGLQRMPGWKRKNIYKIKNVTWDPNVFFDFLNVHFFFNQRFLYTLGCSGLKCAMHNGMKVVLMSNQILMNFHYMPDFNCECNGQILLGFLLLLPKSKDMPDFNCERNGQILLGLLLLLPKSDDWKWWLLKKFIL